MAEETPGDPRAPDPVVPSPVVKTTGRVPEPSGSESREREKAWERGELRARQRADADTDAPNLNAIFEATGIAQRAFVALADNVRDYAIFLMDPEGTIIYWGEGARLIKWWTREQVEGAHFRVLYPDGGAEDGTAEGHLAEAARRGEMVSEGQRIRSDGSTFWAGATLTALRDANGELQGFAKLTRDLTAAHAAEAALKAAKEATETGRKVVAENRAKGAFLAAMSHELRTPLQAIIAYSDLLDMEIAGPLNETQRTQLGRIRVSSKHLLGLATEVLDLSRLDIGGLPVRPGAHGLGLTAEEALLLVVPQADARGLTLTSAIGGSAGELCYWGDEVRVRQIIVNLLANAVKFTPAGGRVTVSAGATQQAPPDAQLGALGPWVYIRVEDNGEGIPADQMGAIFEPYEQLANAGAEGAGLGLAISQRLARLMGGDLTATSVAGVGSSFFLWLENSTTRPATPPE